MNEQGLSTGITALGAAILGPRGEPIGSVSVSGPSSRMTPDKFEFLGRTVCTAAQQCMQR